MSMAAQKRAAARAALALVPEGIVLGVGTGTTVDFFIEVLAESHRRLVGTVASSQRTAERLRARGLEVLDLADVTDIPVYVDGADEVSEDRVMIKGGGGALTREKIVAAAATTFVCIADASKLVAELGAVPLPIEVIPMARSYVARELARRGGRPKLRENFQTDNGNVILDVAGLSFGDPTALEADLDGISGVVASGLFAGRRADTILLGAGDGVRTIP
jgi:ribose 5-phosphate isomerase A